MIDSDGRSTSWLEHPSFFPGVVSTLIVGHAFDLVGTYAYQPNFEHEVNPIYITLKPYGLTLSWPKVIAAKTVYCVLTVCALVFALRKRRRYYPDSTGSFRESFTHFLYGRPITWSETLYRSPKSFVPTLLFVFIAISFSGFYGAYLGYDNLAAKYGWPSLGGFYIGRYWIDYCNLFILPASVVFTVVLLWDDIRFSQCSSNSG